MLFKRKERKCCIKEIKLFWYLKEIIVEKELILEI